jgi:excisionase family DNA binding protein
MISQEDLTSYGSNGNTGHAVPYKTAAKVTRDRLLTPEEVAARFQVCTETVLRWARQKKLKRIRMSKKVVRFSEEEVKRFINSHEEAETTSCENGRKGSKIRAPKSKVVEKGGCNNTSRKSWGSLHEEVASWR